MPSAVERYFLEEFWKLCRLGVSVDAWLPDLDAFQTTAGFAALSAMDDDPTATMIYIDDQALATAFGETAGQDALSLDDLIA